ncbi:hypothetical protein A6S26_09800 [Nostoc sp. ATCC 43529]|nr:hypothetical protein A6S26_09800 [Nostoc sp. ATCC 43529]
MATFFTDVLNYRPYNGTEAHNVTRPYYTCSINCVETPGNIEWRYAAWLDKYKQVIFGQCHVNGQLRSLATVIDIVAHEFFHGLNYQVVDFQYYGESGALDESYADIFGILVANFQNNDIGTWNWEIGSGFGSNDRAVRNLSDPGSYGQPEHMRDYRLVTDDHGGVHTNSGIHNIAAYNLLTSQDSQGNYLFDAMSGAMLFYKALYDLSEQSGFTDSRRAIEQAAKTLFRRDYAQPETLQAILQAIATAFDNVGIGDNIGIFE